MAVDEIISDTRKEIEGLILNQPTTMSEYQINNFVIADKMTDFKILKQILLELGTRYTGTDDLEIELEIEKLNLSQMELDLKQEVGDIQKKIAALEIKRQKNNIKSLEKTLSNYLFEIEVMEANYAKIKAVHSDPQSLLDDKTGEEIYWVNKFIKEAQIDIMTGGRIGKGVLDAIMSLPEHLQQVIITQSIEQAASNNAFISLSESNIIDKIIESKQTTLMLNTVIGAKVEQV